MLWQTWSGNVTLYYICINNGSFFEASVSPIGTLAISSWEWKIKSPGLRSPANSSKTLIVVPLANFVRGWLCCLGFLAKINFTGAVVTCCFPFLVLPYLAKRQRYKDDFFKLQPSLFKASVSWSKVLTVLTAINSSLPTCFSSSCDFFESFTSVCCLLAWILRFWFTGNISCRLRAVSFCFRSALLLSVASLNVMSLQSLCERCPRSRFRY